MAEAESYQTAEYVELSVSIVAAYVANNSIPISELSNLLISVHSTVKRLSGESTTVDVVKLAPAQIKKSITPDALISFEDGKAYKALRRHLTIRGLTPEGYRAKWGLPADYPMVAASYSTARSELARSSGLGRQQHLSFKVNQAKITPPDDAVSVASGDVKPKRVGRPRKITK